jgi:hypothetical protein
MTGNYPPNDNATDQQQPQKNPEREKASRRDQARQDNRFLALGVTLQCIGPKERAIRCTHLVIRSIFDWEFGGPFAALIEPQSQRQRYPVSGIKPGEKPGEKRYYGG